MSFQSARWLLDIKATIWRWLMKIGMLLHHRASPRPPLPSFTVRIRSRISSLSGVFKLVFYVPLAYETAPPEQRFPIVVNYHGGGFTIGSETDDARWAQAVVENTEAVFVSVDYRLAPRYPFSVGVEDATDAVIYLAAHAEELRLNPHRIVLSGFSAGGNLALTVPFVLYDLQKDNGKRSLATNARPFPPLQISNQEINNSPAFGLLLESSASLCKLQLPAKFLEPTALEIAQKFPPLTLCGIATFYPPTDFRIPREEKRKTNPRPGMNLPSILTDLFDKSYITSTHTTVPLDLADPYLSPAAASDELLRAAYPASIILYTCEYDMLNAEGTAFGERLASEHVGKVVKGGLIREVPHAFDKKPNPMAFLQVAKNCYNKACTELNVLFGRRESVERRTQLDH